MAEKKLLLLETNFDVAKKYEDFLKESVWNVDHKDSLNNFLASMKENEFDVAVVEGGIVPDKIILMLLASRPVIVCSDNKPKIDEITTIPRRFTGSELVNALGKVSFMKLTEKPDVQDEEFYSIDETISDEKAVFLEPVFGDEEAVELLTPEEDVEPVRSSWEIPNEAADEAVDVEAATLVGENADDVGSEVENKIEEDEEKEQKKEDIFERIDEIDSIIMSINKDVADKIDSEEKVAEQLSEGIGLESVDPFEKDNQDADFLFDDDYKYEEKIEDGAENPEEDNQDGMDRTNKVSDFESILSDDVSDEKDDPEPEKSIELNKDEQEEVEPAKEYEAPVEVAEKIEEPVEKLSNPEEEKVDEKADENKDLEVDVLKVEFRKWLDENARPIIKEVVEEQLKELYGKK